MGPNCDSQKLICPLRDYLQTENGKLRNALTDLVAVFDAEAQGVAQQVTKSDRIAAARAILQPQT